MPLTKIEAVIQLLHDLKQALYDLPKEFELGILEKMREWQQHAEELSSMQRFNRTTDSIAWAKWSWNPVTGCLHGCSYCYARDIAKRFYPYGFAPHFYPERLSAALNHPKPKRSLKTFDRNVFTVSMGDLFGDWVSPYWIAAVLTAIRRAPAFNFLVLTKNPNRLRDYSPFPGNMWVGATVDCQRAVFSAERAFNNLDASVKWLSCEPLEEPLQFGNLGFFDWLVIGARSRTTGMPEMQPKAEWIESLINQARAAGVRVFVKPNITPGSSGLYPMEFPAITDAQEGSQEV